MTETSYHDLHVATATMPRTAFSSLPFNLFVMCTRVGGWELWDSGPDGDLVNAKLVAGEFDTNGMRLDVSGRVVVDSLEKEAGA